MTFLMRWYKTDENKVRASGGLGAVIRSVFGKTALPAISLFPYGISSKPILNKNCFTSQTEINGDNVILGYNFKDDEESPATRPGNYKNLYSNPENKLQAGEIILFSTNDKEEKQATIRIRSKDDEKKDGKGTIEITSANDGVKTAKMTFKSDGGVELYSTSEDSDKQTEIKFGNDGTININSILKQNENEEPVITGITILKTGTIDIIANNNNDNTANINIHSAGTLNITADGAANITANDTLTIDATGETTINASSGLILNTETITTKTATTITAESDLTISGEKVTIDGNLTVTGTISAEKAISSGEEVVAGIIPLTKHTHTTAASMGTPSGPVPFPYIPPDTSEV